MNVINGGKQQMITCLSAARMYYIWSDKLPYASVHGDRSVLPIMEGTHFSLMRFRFSACVRAAA